MRAQGDQRRCMSTGICEAICPEVFRVGPKGVEVLELGPIPEPLEAPTAEAAANCPTEAITLEYD